MTSNVLPFRCRAELDSLKPAAPLALGLLSLAVLPPVIAASATLAGCAVWFGVVTSVNRQLLEAYQALLED